MTTITSAVRFAFLSLTALICMGAVASPAGIVAFACEKGLALYLLAFDPAPRRQAWGHLGGRAEKGETSAQTALRELQEKSNCAFDLPAEVATHLIGPPPFPRNGFQTFVLQVPFIEAATIAQARQCKDVERNQWVWVNHQALEAALNLSATDLPVSDGAPAKVHLWRPSLDTLRKARDDGVLPTKDPCK